MMGNELEKKKVNFFLKEIRGGTKGSLSKMFHGRFVHCLFFNF